jgi:hypothetical protein
MKARASGLPSVALGIAVVAGGAAFLRARSLRWGATDGEVEMVLPGDDLVPRADLTATRAITVRACAADRVWPWIAQLGQGRGGFYSYDFLENLIGCDIHSANRVVPEWQRIEVGARVNLHPELALTVALVEPERTLVLRGGVPIGGARPPYDFTWAAGCNDAAGGARALRILPWLGLLAGGARRVDQLRHEPAHAARHQRAGRTSSRVPDVLEG